MDYIDKLEAEGDVFGTWSDDSLICPYCGHTKTVDWEDFYNESPECSDVKFECEECGKVFLASRSVSFSYETYKIK